MRSKEKSTTRAEILRNFTREFLVEEKRRCEIDRYVTDFRVLIHRSPHENHNYLNRLLQDYTSMFLSHERMSANKMNQDDVKYQLKTQLSSRKKDSPKKRYVKSKLSEKNDENSDHQSYLVLKAKTQEFLRRIQQYDELEQIAYEIFIRNSNSEIKTYQYEIEQVIEPNKVLKLKSSDVPLDIPYKKHYRNVYIVNNPNEKHVVNDKIKNNEKESKNTLESYKYLKEETENFLSNNKNYNDAEQKVLSEQYRKNAYIKKYVDTLTSSEKSKKDPQSPKRGIYSKIKNMIGFSPENSTKFYKNVENNHEALVDKTKMFLRNERKYSNTEFEAYNLFYIKNGEFQNPLIEKIKNIAYEPQKETTENVKKIKIKHLVGLKNAKSNQRSLEKEEFEDFNLVKCSPTEKNEPEQKIRDIQFQFESPKKQTPAEDHQYENTNKIQSTDVEIRHWQEVTNDFLDKQKLYEDQHRHYYVIHTRKHQVNPTKGKKESLFAKVKHLFFGKNEKSKEKQNYFREITQEFLRNEQYHYDLEKQAHIIFSDTRTNRYSLPYSDSVKTREYSIIIPRDSREPSKVSELKQGSTKKKSPKKEVFEETNTPIRKERSKNVGKSGTLKKQEKSRTPPSSLHQRSKSEDLLMLRTRTRSLEGNKSPTGHKSFADRLKSMVGIGNRRRTKSRENILRLTDPVQYFLEHERFYYGGVPEIDREYGRSISAVEHIPKDGTIKTKTRKFLSTENVLYQDNSSLVDKPPSGRRRKQERNRDSREKRRSRTLSPAQKLVSKIRNLVHKNTTDKEKEDPNLVSKETSPSDLLAAPLQNTDKTESMVDNSSSTVFGTNKNNSATENAFAKQKIQNEQSPIINEKASSFVSGNSKTSEHVVVDDPNFIKNQTRVFLHDIKKYHDLDKEPNTVDKTLIFINNKSGSMSYVNTNVTEQLIRGPEPNEKILLKSMVREEKTDKSTHEVGKNTTEKHTEQKTEVESINNRNIKQDYSSTETTHKVTRNTIIKESRITQRMKTEKVQQRTINELPLQNATKNINDSETISAEFSTEKNHFYENVLISKNLRSENTIPQNRQHKKYEAQSPENTTRPDEEETEKILKKINKKEMNVADMGKITNMSQQNESKKEHDNNVSDRSMKKKPNKIENSKTMYKTFENEFLLQGKNSQKQSREGIPTAFDPNNEMIRDQTSAFLRTHQYLIHKEEMEFKKVPMRIEKEEVGVIAAEKQSSAPLEIGTSPNKEQKPKKNAFSKLKFFVNGTSKKQSTEESNILIRKRTSEFLDDIRKHHDVDKDAMAKYKIVWLSEKKIEPTRVTQQLSEPTKLIAMSEQEKERLGLIRQNTEVFLKDHQVYHNKQRTEDNDFLGKIGKPEKFIWLSSRPTKKNENIITKVKNLMMSPQHSKKNIPPAVDPNDKILRDQTGEFLRKHQYLIDKEEVELKNTQVPLEIVSEKVGVVAAEKQTSAPRKTEKSPEKDQKPKKNAFSKLKSFVSATPKKPSTEESNRLLRQQTSDFLDDIRKHHDVDKDAMAKYKIVWLSEKKIEPTRVTQQLSEPTKLIAISEQEKGRLRLIRQNTEVFLRDHQVYHNKQRTEDNDFLGKIGKPEKFIWLSSRPIKKNENVITKVKNLMMSPQHSKKNIPLAVDPNDKIIRDQTDKFLRKHQYLIHKEEVELKNTQVPLEIVSEKVGVVAAEKQTSAPERTEKSPEKDQKAKKNVFSKLKSFVSASPKKPSTEESNKLLRQQTSDFLDDIRKHHDVDKDAMAKYKIVWLSEKKIEPTRVTQQLSEPTKLIAMSEQEKERLRLIRQNTEVFLKDHQVYHNKQRTEDNDFLDKIGKPEKFIWLSSRPTKKNENIITKVKNLMMSPQHSKKNIPPAVDPNDKILRDQTDEFLRKHQYLIDKEEVELKNTQVPLEIVSEKVGVVAAEKQTSTPRKTEKSPEKDQKPKKNAFSKLKSFVSATPKKPSTEESNRLLRQQTSDFLDDIRKHHDVDKDAMAKYEILWLSEKKIEPTRVTQQLSEPTKLIAMSEQEKERLSLIRQNTEVFLKDHQVYHNKQRTEDNDFLGKIGKPEKFIWLSSRPIKKNENVITKVKNLMMSPQHSKKNIPLAVDPNDKIIRDQTDEFLRKHQYLIHKEEVELKNTQVPLEIVSEKVGVVAAEKQTSAPERTEMSPEKDQKAKKNVFSKLKSFVSASPKKPSTEESNKLLRQQTSDFLDDIRKHHDVDKDAMAKYEILWLSEKKIEPTRVTQQLSEPTKLIAISEQEKGRLRLIRQNTEVFLRDHQVYHNKQRTEDNDFLGKIGKPEKFIWLSSRPIKKNENVITKVKNLMMSPQHSKKNIPLAVDPNDKIIRDQTDKFLRKHQYLIHKEEVELKNTQVPLEIVSEKVGVVAAEKQISAPERTEKSPEKDQKAKKNVFSKLKSFVSASPKKPSTEGSNKLLRQQTSDFLDDIRKHHDVDKDAMAKYKIVWLSEKKIEPTRVTQQLSEPTKLIAMSEQEKERLRLIRQNTEVFLKDHQVYHNKQRTEDNDFLGKIGKPEKFIRLSSRPTKKNENIITKVKNLMMSPQHSKKNIPPAVDPNDKILRDQTDEFLRKHQYLIDKEEVELKNTQVPLEIVSEKVGVVAAEKQTSAPERTEKSPEKDQKAKKNVFSKLKSFVSASPKKPSTEESNKLLRQQTSDFLDDIRKHHDVEKDAMAKYKILWLSEKKIEPTRVTQQLSEPTKLIAMSEQEKGRLRLIRQNTEVFLKDHQVYHNKQRTEDNDFLGKMGKLEKFIWLSSRPIKKNENVITKVKNLMMSPQRSKKNIPLAVDPNDKILRDQTDEFLRKHQYLIHKEEVELKNTQVPSQIVSEKFSVVAAENRTSAPKRTEKSPEKDQKPKKNAFSKLKSFVSASPKKSSTEESNKLLRQQTSDFLDDIRKHHDVDKDAMAKYEILWLSEKKIEPTRVTQQLSEPTKLIAISEQEKGRLRLIRQNTEVFLRDHQVYHNKQRTEDNDFLGKIGKPEKFIWLSSRPIKKNENVITKVKNLMMSPQHSKKNIPLAVDPNDKIIRDQTDKFLRKHQYLIHKEEVELKNTQVPLEIVSEKVGVVAAEKQISAPERTEKSPEKDQKAKKNVFSKLKSFVSASPKKTSTEESNKLLRQQTSDFLDDIRKHHDVDKDAMAKYKIVWLSEKKIEPTRVTQQLSEPTKLIAMSEQEKERLRLIRQNTEVFLKDHQVYHNKQRTEDNDFLGKIGKPEKFIWLSSRPTKKNENIITKVKNLMMSPQHSKKNIPPAVDPNDKILRDQTDEFLRKHQYLIDKEEVELKNTQVPLEIVSEKVGVVAAEKQTSAPRKTEKSPEKDQKPKKNAFSKLKSFVSATPKKPSTEESNRLLRQQTSDFLDDIRKHHDVDKDAMAKYEILWLSEKKIEPSRVTQQLSEPTKLIAISEQEKGRLRLIRQNTEVFLRDHQVYHNKQRTEDNDFLGKIGKPEKFIWLSSRPIKKNENVITKVKNLMMSPQHSKKNIPLAVDPNDKIIRDQTDEFLRKHQYLIHKEEVELKNTQVPLEIVSEKVGVVAAEKQTSAPERTEKSPEKDQKAKKNVFSKLKSFVSASPKKPSTEESNKLLRQQTSDFLDDIRKHHDVEKDAMAKYKILWLSEKKIEPTRVTQQLSEPTKLIAMSEQEKGRLRLIRQNTEVFLKDHQVYHNKQRTEDNDFLGRMGKPEKFIWLSSRPIKKNENVITKVKNLMMSPQRSKKNIPLAVDPNDKILRDQTDEFLRKHQYLIHKEEVELKNTQVPSQIVSEKFSVVAAENRTSAPKRTEKSPEKDQKPKKNAFSKLKSFVSASPKKSSTEESNKLLRQQTSDFLDDIRKHHDVDKEAMAKYEILWLSENKIEPTRVTQQLSESTKLIGMSEKEREGLRLIRQNTEVFLKYHQVYHNKQRTEDNDFLGKIGQPENFIWLSSRPIKKNENIITKVKNLMMSPQLSKKNISIEVDPNDKIIRYQTDEFLRKHQYLIHKEELESEIAQVPMKIVGEKVRVIAAPQRTEMSSEKEQKPKKNAFSKLKSFVSGTPKVPSLTEATNKLLRQQTSEFLDDMRKHHYLNNDVIAKCKIVWLSEQETDSMKPNQQLFKPTKLIAKSEPEKESLGLIRQNKDDLLKDNKQKIEHHNVFSIPGHSIQKTISSEDASSASITNIPIESTRDVVYVHNSPKIFETNITETIGQNVPPTPRKNIISKVKDILSPSNPHQTAVFYYDSNEGMDVDGKNSQDKTDEFSAEGQYPINYLSPQADPSLAPSVNMSLSTRQKKKVTFSKSSDTETPQVETFIEEKITEPQIPLESNKPQAVPRNQIAKKVKTVLIDSAEIFRQDKERYLIQETSEFLEDHKKHQKNQWIVQHSVGNPKGKDYNLKKEVLLGNSKPEPPPRKMKHVIDSPSIAAQSYPSAEKSDNAYFETRRNLLLFLDDHQAYHEKERSHFISFISKQNKPHEIVQKTIPKEPKVKTKLMSKIKSLVGHSQENITLDKKRDIVNALLRKQTSEFLISQKCYHDLEVDACHKFSLEHSKIEGNKLIGNLSDKQKTDSNSAIEGDSTFCSSRKLSIEESPKPHSKKNQKPLKSSLGKKISKTDNITTKEITDSKNDQKSGDTHSKSTEYLLSIEESKNFLDGQRNHINLENEIWKQYLKYKPGAGSNKKITPSNSEEKYSNIQYTITTPNASARKSSSQIESEKIDHEVILHKTKLFLEDHKSFHDNLQNESCKYVPKKTEKTSVEGRIKKKGEGVLMKVKSLLPSGNTKNRSYDIQKAQLPSHEYNKAAENSNNMYVERKENLEMVSSPKELEMEIKELTKNFLQDHQEYHNQERLHPMKSLSKEDEKIKKSKKGVISKLKSLVVGDSHKKISSKKPMNASVGNFDELDSTVSNEKENISIIELASSPETYRRSRPRNPQHQLSEEQQTKISTQKNSDPEKPASDIDIINRRFIDSSNSGSKKHSDAQQMSASLIEDNGAIYFEKIDADKLLLYYDQEVLPEDERKKYAAAKIKTQEFLLNEKQFMEIDDNKTKNITEINYDNNPESGENIPSVERNNITEQMIVTSEQKTSKTLNKASSTKENSNNKEVKFRDVHHPSAPSLEECEELSEREKENIQSVIHRVVTPLSPTKTIFKEIRKREDSPDRKVYMVKEGYMITKGNKNDVKTTKDHVRSKIGETTKILSSYEERPQMKEAQGQPSPISNFDETRSEKLSRNLSSHLDGSASLDAKESTEGQDYVDKSNDSPSQSVPQGDLEVRRHHTKNCYFILLVVLVVLIAIYSFREEEDES